MFAPMQATHQDVEIIFKNAYYCENFPKEQIQSSDF